MKPIAILLFLIYSTWNIFPQTTSPGYELPKPMPVSGATPNTVIKPGGSYAPTAYNDPRPGMYDKFIWGGHRSYGTLAERNTAPWRIEGMLAYVAETTNTYRLMPDLLTWEVAFVPGGGGGGGVTNNVYTSDGTISSNRIFGLGTNTLTYTGGTGSIFRINSSGNIEYDAAQFVSTVTGVTTLESGGALTLDAASIANASSGNYSVNAATNVSVVSGGSATIASSGATAVSGNTATLSGVTQATLSSPAASVTATTTGLNATSSGNTAVSGAASSLSGSVSASLLSPGPVQINGASISNISFTLDNVVGQRINTIVNGLHNMNSESLNVIATNLIDLQTSCMISLGGADIEITGTANTSITSSGPLKLQGLSITNIAGRIDHVSTTGIGISAATTALVNAATLNLTSSTALNASSIGPVTVNGSTVRIAGTTNAATAATGDVVIDGNDIRIITDEIRSGTAVNGFVVTLANTNGRVNFSPVIGGGVISDGTVSATKMLFSGTNSIFGSGTNTDGQEWKLGPEWVFEDGMLQRNYRNIMFDVNMWGMSSTPSDTSPNMSAIGTGATTGIGGEPGHAGVNTYTTTVATNGVYGMSYRGDAIQFEPGNIINLYTRWRVPVLPVSGDVAYRMAIGYGDHPGSTALYSTDCIAVTLSADENAGAITLDCGAAGVHTLVSSGVTAVANTWYEVKIKATTTLVEWWLDGLKMTSCTNNIPSGTNKFSTQWRIVNYNGITTNASAFQLDQYNAKGFYVQ